MHLAATNISLPLDGGVFDCPSCVARRRYLRRREEAYVSVFFVPLGPVGDGADFVECLACGGTFNESATQPRGATADEELAERIVRLMTLVMIRDGRAGPQELDAIRSFAAATLGRVVHEADIWDDIRAAQMLDADALSYSAHLRGLLSARQRELALAAAKFIVSLGDNDPPRSAAYLSELSDRLGIGPGSQPAI
jgi:hypothetical protein